jgi:uncharacterized protein (TIGR03083 family)
MEMTDHLAALLREGRLLAEAAEASELDAPIPTCPDWRMRDLLQHMGDVHRWAAAHVAQPSAEPIRRVEGIAGPLPDDADLLAWFRQGHAALVETLKAADPDVECWSFLPAPSPLAFWSRRQAHETGIHRADAQSPSGAITGFEPGFAEDGIDELLFGFFGRPPPDGALETPPRTLCLRATDADASWFVRVDGDGVRTERMEGDADCSVAGTASDLHLLLWNRRSPEGLDLRGDDQVLRSWREHAQIHWGRPR